MKTLEQRPLSRHSHRLGPLVGCLFLALVLMALAGCRPDLLPRSIKALRGELDLRTQPLTDTGSVALDGEWEFYWNRLLTPEDFQPGGDAPAAHRLLFPSRGLAGKRG